MISNLQFKYYYIFGLHPLIIGKLAITYVKKQLFSKRNIVLILDIIKRL